MKWNLEWVRAAYSIKISTIQNQLTCPSRISTGIHNEPGVTRSKLQSLEVTVTTLLNTILAPKPDSWHPTMEQPVAVMVNNLGGLSPLEISIIAEEVHQQLEMRSIIVKRFMFGTFVTALDGPGFSVTLLGLDDELLSLLDAPTTAPGWPKSILTVPADVVTAVIEQSSTEVTPILSHTGPKGKQYKRCQVLPTLIQIFSCQNNYSKNL